MQVFFVFFAIMCGGIYFEEFNSVSPAQYAGFVVGVVMILGGVYGLAPKDVPIIPPPILATVVSKTHMYAHPDETTDLEKGADFTHGEFVGNSSSSLTGSVVDICSIEAEGLSRPASPPPHLRQTLCRKPRHPIPARHGGTCP